MLRNVALILLPLALLASACGGSSNDTAVRDSDDAPEAVGAAGPDGIYNTKDDLDVGGVPILGDPADSPAGDPAVVSDDIAPSDDTVASTSTDDVADDARVIADDAGRPQSGNTSLDDNAVLGALNPFSFLSGMGALPFNQDGVDPVLGAALLTAGDVPAAFEAIGEFSFSTPSEFGEMDMAMRMFGSGFEADDFGAMILSAALRLPPEAMSELDELIGMTEADLAELQDAAEFGMEFADLQILNADSLGDGGFGMHMEIDFGALLSVFGAPEDESVPAGIAMDMYAFAVGDRVLMVMVMWPTGESPGVDALTLAQIMESRA